jgi:hypothetical protein
MSKLIDVEEQAEYKDSWLSRKDAATLGKAIALSEPWPRRMFINIAAQMCQLTRHADRWVCALESREDRAVTPATLTYLKEHSTPKAFNSIRHMLDLDLELELKLNPGKDGVMRSYALTTVLGAGFRAEDARDRKLAETKATVSRDDLAAQQRRVLDSK